MPYFFLNALFLLSFNIALLHSIILPNLILIELKLFMAISLLPVTSVDIIGKPVAAASNKLSGSPSLLLNRMAISDSCQYFFIFLILPK